MDRRISLKRPTSLGVVSAVLFLIYACLSQSTLFRGAVGGYWVFGVLTRTFEYSIWITVAIVLNVWDGKGNEYSRFADGFWAAVICGFLYLILMSALSPQSPPPAFTLTLIMGIYFYSVVCGLLANPRKTRKRAITIGIVILISQFILDIVLGLSGFYGSIGSLMD